MKTKTYVLTLSKTFPKGHPREGEETGFDGSVNAGIYYAEHPDEFHVPPVKIHTIRPDYDLWKRRIDEVNAGMAVLSVREWLGAPRRSKQRELYRFDRYSGIGVEKLEWGWEGAKAFSVHNPALGIGYADWCVPAKVEALAANDGLSLEDWENWFRGCDKSRPMAIIHFTKFRYCK